MTQGRDIAEFNSLLGRDPPAEFVRMKNSGWLDNGDYLWIYEAEWLTAESARERLRHVRSARPICPFAFTGRGDLWCWLLDNPNQLPVVECPRDSFEGRFYAPSFSAFLFRRALDFAAGGYDSLDEGRSWLRAWRKRLAAFWPERWLSLIDEIQGRSEIVEVVFNMPVRYLVSDEEAVGFLRQEWAWARLDQSFSWQL